MSGKPTKHVAIDFGTTRTKVAYWDEERRCSRLISLGREIRDVLPSVFYLPPEGEGEVLVGDDACEMVEDDPVGVVVGLKRELHKLRELRCGPGRRIDRVKLASHLFEFIRTRCEAEVFHGRSLKSCTLTVPVAFEEQRRSCLVRAAEAGGFKEVTLLEEPVAAGRAWLAECKREEDSGGQVVVCDIGGGPPTSRF